MFRDVDGYKTLGSLKAEELRGEGTLTDSLGWKGCLRFIDIETACPRFRIPFDTPPLSSDKRAYRKTGAMGRGRPGFSAGSPARWPVLSAGAGEKV